MLQCTEHCAAAGRLLVRCRAATPLLSLLLLLQLLLLLLSLLVAVAVVVAVTVAGLLTTGQSSRC